MLLTLIKRRKTRYGWQAELIETNSIFGDRHLGVVHLWLDDWPLPLIYPLHITHSGFYIRDRMLRWTWRNTAEKKAAEAYLKRIQKSREEIFLDVL